ncbi:MAG: hypothetical protein ACI4JM_08780 [Oscillospiraceae bacterium]
MNGDMNNSNENRRIDPKAVVNAAGAVYGVIQMFAPLIKRIANDMNNIYQNLDAYQIDRIIDISFLKGYRKKNDSEIVIAKVESLLKNQQPSEQIRNMSILKDEYMIAEYDAANERVVQSDFLRRNNIAENIMTVLNANDGILFVKEKTK